MGLPEGCETEGQASRASPLPLPTKSAFMGLPQMNCVDPGGAAAAGWGTLSCLMPTHGSGITGLAQPQADHPRDVPPSLPPAPGRSKNPAGLSTTLHAPRTHVEAEWDHQPPGWGFPSHIFPSPGGKGARGTHPSQGRHPGAACSTSCSPREEEESWG